MLPTDDTGFSVVQTFLYDYFQFLLSICVPLFHDFAFCFQDSKTHQYELLSIFDLMYGYAEGSSADRQTTRPFHRSSLTG